MTSYIRLLQLLIFLLSANFCFGQVDSLAPKKNIWGVNIGALGSAGNEGVNYYIYGTVEKGKHFVALGPAFGPNLKNRYSINGANLVYQLCPNPTNKRFNFFFEYNLIYLYFKDEGSYYRYNSGSYIEENYLEYRASLENYIGYGFRVKFLKNFYLNQSVGIGVLYTYNITYYETLNDNKRSEYSPSVVVKIGLGYKFNKK